MEMLCNARFLKSGPSDQTAGRHVFEESLCYAPRLYRGAQKNCKDGSRCQAAERHIVNNLLKS